MPTLRESTETGEYKLNGASYHQDCKTLSENEVLAKDLDRQMRDEVRSEETALPMGTWEKVKYYLLNCFLILLCLLLINYCCNNTIAAINKMNVNIKNKFFQDNMPWSPLLFLECIKSVKHPFTERTIIAGRLDYDINNYHSYYYQLR